MKMKYTDLLNQNNVVGVITKKIELLNATFVANWPNYRFNPITELNNVDVYELRLDSLAGLDTELMEFIKANEHSPKPKPLIFTARDASEGGVQKNWTLIDRVSLYEKYLPYATFIDIEASTAGKMAGIIGESKELGVGVIISYHNFELTPNSHMFVNEADTCRRMGGCVFKIATKVYSSSDVVQLIYASECLRMVFDFKVATMAIGERYGKIQRYLDAIVGGPFTYGYLFDAVVLGQPRATEVKKVLSTLR